MEHSNFAGAILTIDLDAVAANYRILRDRLQGVECAAVVKADAYGLGVEPVAKALVRAGCRRFFVSTIDEGAALRSVLAETLPEATICVLTGLPPGGGAEACAALGLTPVLVSPDQIESWVRFCRARGEALGAAVKIDTGMSRLGLSPEEVDSLAREPGRLGGMGLAFVMSHLACADEPDHPSNRLQLEAFRRALAALPRSQASLANSSGIFLGRAYHFDFARPGAALYGVSPTRAQPNPMRPVVSLHGRILQLRDVDAGATVGYGATHRVAGPGRLATVAVGYADGYLRSLGNRGAAHVGEIRVPVVGRVSMDLTVFDVSDVPAGQLRPGDTVEIIGHRHTVDDLAAEAGTIGYEILTGLGRRYHRSYLGG